MVVVILPTGWSTMELWDAPGGLLTNRVVVSCHLQSRKQRRFLVPSFVLGFGFGFPCPPPFLLFPLAGAEGQELEAAVEGLVTRPSCDRRP